MTARGLASVSLEMDRLAPGRDAIVSFLKRLADNSSDFMPDRAETNVPSSITGCL